MNKVQKITDEIIAQILTFLYRDERLNVILIHIFENDKEQIGELYLHLDNQQIKSILHVKDDGNSHLATFFAVEEKYLSGVAHQINDIQYDDLLLAGSVSDVRYILKCLNREIVLDVFEYYVFDTATKALNNDDMFSFRRAYASDFNIVYQYMIDFFEAGTEQAKKRIRNRIKLDNIRLLIYDNQVVGYASFYGYSKHYIDISNIYIAKSFRGRRYADRLLAEMTNEARLFGKKAILQTNQSNLAANKLYQRAGFKSALHYTFAFINHRL